ncbi:MAG: peptidoglycan binding domain-containing protein, partial [Anaerolineae bacterium]|nr:peptidoglycan binding domain-containing protein [Thermoflexales bacterium]MDW8406904.1 peptidoglycan binding domain-containing protein [Anaerolineae bacterium]
MSCAGTEIGARITYILYLLYLLQVRVSSCLMIGFVQTFFRPAYLILSTFIVACVGGLLALVGLQVQYTDRVFPGVRFQGVDLSGKRPEEVFQLAHGKAADFHMPLVTLRLGERAIILSAADLGLTIDPAATTDQAMRIGRTGDLPARLREQVQTWWAGAEIAPVAIMDEVALNRLLNELAAELEISPQNAGVVFEAGAAREITARPGVALDIPRAQRVIRVALSTGRPIDLAVPTRPVAPRVISAASAAAFAAQALSADLVLMAPRWNEAGAPIEPVEALRIPRAELPGFLSFHEISATIDTTPSLTQTELSATLNRARLRPLIESLAAAVNETPDN